MAKEKQRKLTPAEKRRADNFDRISQQLQQDGYERQDCTVGALKANIYAIFLMLPFAILSMVVFYITLTAANITYSPSDSLLALVLVIVLTVLHEAIHGLTWGIFAKDHFKSIEFGVIWQYLTPYCTCAEPLSKTHYILGGMMPTLLLGFGLSALSCLLGSTLLQVLAVFMIFGGGGDALIILKMLRFGTKGKNVLFFDHPFECGFVAFVKADK